MVDDSPSIRRLEMLAELWRWERETTRERFAEERRGQTLAERVERGLALSGLVIDEAEAVAGGRLRLWLTPEAPDALDDLRVSTGDPVRLWWDDPDQPDAVVGVAARRAGQRLAVVVDDLMRFPSESMYDGQLVADASVAQHRLEDLGVAPDPERPGPLVFVDTAGRGWDDTRSPDDPSTHNPESARHVAGEVRRLVRRGVAPSDVAVITPYEAQARTLRELLRELRAKGLEVGTVDGFQGREKQAIVVDLVRSNPDGEIGFLRDVRRMNVALTRARRFLLVVGDSATLAGDRYYQAFLDAAERGGTWLSAWTADPDAPL